MGNLIKEAQEVNKSMFEKLFAINVNEKTEQKNGLTYLSWSWAWAEFKKVYPDAVYEIKRNEQGMPFIYDETLGYMVFTSVTAEGLTYEMWLPVMDGANKAMKNVSYEYQTKYGVKTVEPATMFDINKTIMRCLVKNLAMFGLGLYVYSGEDLPEEEKVEKQEEQKKKQEEQKRKLEEQKREREKITAGTLKQIDILVNQFAQKKSKTVEEVYQALKEKFKYEDINNLTNADGTSLSNLLVKWNRQSETESRNK